MKGCLIDQGEPVFSLPDTITLLPEKPSWEIILTTSQDRRNKDRMSIHTGLFRSLWSDAGKMGENQGEWEHRKIYEVVKQKDSHNKAVTEISKWIWNLLNTAHIDKLRFSTGKYLDSDLNPRYDNFVDVDVSMVLESGKFEHLIIMVDKMLGFDRIYSRYLKQGA